MEGIDIVGIKLFNVAINPGHSPYIYIYNVCVCVFGMSWVCVKLPDAKTMDISIV